ncbi:MAG: Hsp20/alpha crystallin family protein [Acidobacteria bacterium]|nr:Hsp20/alpha crystallin family protein [Acidobacteriota bacterium]
MTSTKWDPFRELNKIIATRWEMPGSASVWNPAMDVIETETGFVLKVHLPGMDTRDIDVRVDNHMLVLRGQRHIEREYESFSRSFSLPAGVNENEIKADYKNGTLTISMPKQKEVKPRPIKIDAA